MKNKNNKKQIIAKLAGVTMIATTGLGTVAPLTGAVQGVVGFAEGETEVSNFTVKGSYSIQAKPVDETKKLYDGYSIITDQNYILNFNGKLKAGNTVTINLDGITFGTKSSDITLSGKTVGKIEFVRTTLNDGGMKSEGGRHYMATDENLNDTKNEIYNSSTYKITFNKEIEDFENPTISFSFKNVYNEARKFSKLEGQNYKLKAQFGNKTAFDDTILLKGYNQITTKRLAAGVGNGWYAGTIKNDGSVEQNHFLPFSVNPKLNSSEDPELKVGDLIDVTVDDNDLATIGLSSNLKVGDIIQGTDTFNSFNSESHATNKKSGIILEKTGNTKFKVIENGLNHFVLEIIKVGGPGTISNIGGGTPGSSTLNILSTKGIDYNKMEMTPLTINTRILRNGKEIYKNTNQYKPRFSGAQVGASGNLIKRGSVVVEFVDENGKSIKAPVIVSNNQPVGDSYKTDLTPLKSLDGYKFKSVKPGSAPETGKVIEGKQVITLQFEKNKQVKENDDVEITTKWIDESGKSIKPDVKADKDQEAGKVDGYTFLRTERDGNEVYKHIFKKNEEPKKVVTRLVDEDGKVIKEKPGTTPKEDLPDYNFVRTEKDKDGNTIHHYHSITTIFKDEDGKVIKTEKGKKTPDSIPGYTFIKTETDKDGNVITHTYHKIVTKFVNNKDGKEIVLKTVDGDQSKEDLPGYSFVETKKDPKTGDVTHFYKENEPVPIETLTIFKDENGNVIKTEKGKKDPDKIPGYTFIKTEIDKDGNTVHTYHKILTKFVTTKDGKEIILKTKDGDQPKEEIDGYEFESSEKDPSNGDVIHRYKVKAKVADKKEAVKTGASAGQFILPLVGLGGLGGLVTFAARRKAKRKG